MAVNGQGDATWTAFLALDFAAHIVENFSSGPAVAEHAASALAAARAAGLPVIHVVPDIGHLIVAGVATSGTVLSTTRWAVDPGDRVTVCADACADMDPGAHAALLDESVFPGSWLGLWRIARVLPAARISDLAA